MTRSRTTEDVNGISGQTKEETKEGSALVNEKAAETNKVVYNVSVDRRYLQTETGHGLRTLKLELEQYCFLADTLLS